MAISVWVVTLVDRAMTWVYDKSDGQLGSRLGNKGMLVLHTTGRKSGKPRRHTLQYLADGANYVIVASHNGQDRHPGWYHNLLSHPHVRIQIGRRRQAATSHRGRTAGVRPAVAAADCPQSPVGSLCQTHHAHDSRGDLAATGLKEERERWESRFTK